MIKEELGKDEEKKKTKLKVYGNLLFCTQTQIYNSKTQTICKVQA